MTAWLRMGVSLAPVRPSSLALASCGHDQAPAKESRFCLDGSTLEFILC